MKVYYSPGYENRKYQEDLSDADYALWVQKFMWDEGFAADYVSPFNANESIMSDIKISDQTKSKTDYTTLYELQVFANIKESFEYKDRAFRGLFNPPLIGPDRGTLQHTKNTIESFNG